MSYRFLNNPGLVTSLENEEEYVYAHLIKFEKPLASSSQGFVSGKAENYAYLTDGSYNISYDDGSVDSRGNLNSTQNYIANKILKVGTVNETIEAKASNMSLVLTGNALNTSTVANFTFTSTTITSTVDLIEAGFSTGDVIRFEKLSAANDQEYVRIDSFSNANKTINYTHISGSGITVSGTPTEYAIVFASEEVSGLANSKQSLDYSSYINREVFIWRAHLNPTTGAVIGTPFLIFKGIITNGSIKDDVTRSSEVTWTLTSHWGDFVQVNGRITSDHAHRALNVNAIPDVEAVLRPEYASDLGFYHAEQAINVIATYQEPVTKYKTKKRGGLAGLFGGTKQIEYTEMVDRDVDLQFNLSAKYIPIVYGVQKISGIPFFAEGDAANAKKVYVAQAICEGPIQGIYDVHIDDSPIICTNSSDFNARNTGDAEVLCVGRADRGDVLAGTSYINKSSFLDIDLSLIGTTISGFLGESSQSRAYTQYDLSNNIGSAVGGAGIIHENKFNLDSPLTTEVIFHAGVEDQSANSFLVKKAAETGFKIQSEYYSTSLSPLEYWGPQHQVLDTAYAVMNFTIAEGETTIPDYDFIVKGKILECYNYDRSYSGVGDHTKFNIGDYVTLRNKEDDSQLGATTVQIIDKWSFYKPDGTLTYRYRFDKNYQLVEENPGLLEDVTSFYMENATADKWYLAAYNHVPLDTAPVPEPIVDKAFQNTTIKSETTDGIAITYNNTTFNYEITGLGVTSIPEFELMSYLKITVLYTTGQEGNSYIVPIDTYTAATGKVTFPATAALQLSNAYRAINSTYTGDFTVSAADVVKLHTNASTVDDEYTNMYITIKKFDTSGNYTTHFSQILDYVGSTQLAKLALSPSYTVTSDNILYTFSLAGSDIFSLAATSAVAEDKRVSINPAIQILDYLTNKRYGKGLDLDKDIDLESFLATARVCDTRSKITVQVLESEGSVLQVGDIYKYPSTGALLFQGKIDSVSDIITINGTSLREVTFTDVIGKLAYKWNDWRQYTTDTIVWWNGTAFKPTSSGTISEANRDSYIASNAFSDSGTRIVLSKVSGTGSASFNLSTSFKTSNDTNALVDNHLGNPVIKKFTSLAKGFTSTGYSLYDSDDCPYWVYLGWDEPEQRYVTRHQTNLTVDTSQSVFSNINGMLQQFNGILRYSAGKYALSLKSAAPDDSYFTTYTSKVITEDEIIGEVKLDDSGSKKTYNTINANIIDPQNKFGARSITFLNSDYIKQDKGVKKTGNYNVPGISNYFNARINIKQNLDESRYGLTVSFTIDSKGYLLLSGDVIKLSYSRFGWNEKYFRINSLNFTADGLVQVVAEEHNDEAYLIEYLDTGRSAETLEGSNTGKISLPSPEAPTSVTASTTLARIVEITWTNGANFNPDVFATEIQRATQSDFSDAQLIATIETNTFTDTPPGDFNVGDVTRYYRVRHIYSNTRGTALNKFTSWVPAAAAGIALRTSKTETGLSAVENLDADGQVVTGIERDVSINQGGVTFETTIQAGGPKLRTQGTFFDTDAVTPAGNPGFYLGYAADTDGIGNDDSGYKFFVGNPSGESLVFDGTNLSVTGNISANSGDIGGLTIGTSSVYVGTGTFNNANTAFYVDDQGQFSLKDALSWNGTTLTISGSISATTGTIGGFTVGSTDLTAGTGTSHISLSTAEGIHLGADAFGNAPFSVSLAGALTATNATITGAVTATSGSFTGAINATSGDFTGAIDVSNTITVGSGNSTVVLDGRPTATYSIFSGATNSNDAPFKIDSNGAITATNIFIYNENGELILDPTGLHGPAYTDISVSSGAGVPEVSGLLDNDTDEITVTTTVDNETWVFETKVAIDDNDGSTNNISGASTVSTVDAEQQLINSQLKIDYYVQPDGGSYSIDSTKAISFVNSLDPVDPSAEIKVYGVDRGAGYSGSLTRYFSVIQEGGACEVISYQNASGSWRSRSYAITTSNINFPTAGTYRIKIVARIVETGTNTLLTTLTSPPLTNNQSTGVVLDAATLNQSSLQNFRRLYSLRAGSIIALSIDDTYTTGTSFVATTGGTISGDLEVTGDISYVTLTASEARSASLILKQGTTSTYSIGLLEGSDFATVNGDVISFNSGNNLNDEGFIWRDAAHTASQGAMSLSNDGKLYVAETITVGGGQALTSSPNTTNYDLYVSGGAYVGGDLSLDTVTAFSGINSGYYLTLKDFDTGNNSQTLTVSAKTLTTTTQTAISTFSATTYAGGKFVITAIDGSNRHICELLVTHNGTTAVATQYGSVYTSAELATYDVDISGGNVRILATSASTNSTVYKVANNLIRN